MRLPPLRLLVLDTETTGFVPKVHRVMEIACATVDKGKVQSEYDQLLSLPEGCDIPAAVQMLTRITPKDIEGQPTFEDIQPTLEKLLTDDTVIVGQNVKFDLGMLRGEGWDLTERPWIDTAMLASIVFPELASYSLGYVSKALSLTHDPPHRALGDVRATVELLSKCYERLTQLPAEDIAEIIRLSERGPEGYKRFFAAVASASSKRPSWLKAPTTKSIGKIAPVVLPPPALGTVHLAEEPIDPAFTPSVIAGLKGPTWLAVKNIEAAAERSALPKDVTVIYPPEFVLSIDSVKKLLEQKAFTADELTTVIKLYLYEPTVRADMPIHGEEYAVFSGKLGCQAESPEYKALRAKADKGPAVISHQHLLSICAPEFPVPLPEDLSLLIDDASMLEDTATSAFAWFCTISSLRAASQGNTVLTKCVDLIELWAERVRNEMDLRYLAPSDLEARECIELKRVIDTVLESDLPDQARLPLNHLLLILNRDNLAGRISWIESMMDGSKMIKSVPEDIAALLHDRLYSATHTTLLIPPGSGDKLAAIVPSGTSSEVIKAPAASDGALTLSMPVGVNLEAVFQECTGKMIVLVSSKRTIEDLYVKHALRAEEIGVTLLCQGFNGGQSRMQAEFAQAKEPAVMVMTPWTFEGVDLPSQSVDRLVLQVMPFDHPSHPVVSRRAQRCKDPFNDYSIPRLKHRIFRLIRTFRKHAKKGARMDILDERLRTKQYGKDVAKYLESLLPAFRETAKPVTVKKEAPKKEAAPKKSKKSDAQMPLL